MTGASRLVRVVARDPQASTALHRPLRSAPTRAGAVHRAPVSSRPRSTARAGVAHTSAHPSSTGTGGHATPFRSSCTRAWTWWKMALRSAMRASILLTACITVVWSRSPNTRPIAG